MGYSQPPVRPPGEPADRVEAARLLRKVNRQLHVDTEQWVEDVAEAQVIPVEPGVSRDPRHRRRSAALER